MRRMPVRYIKHKLDMVCKVCGKPGAPNNPLQASHLIPFNKGIKKFRLTPDFLDRVDNIVPAHRTTCNKAAELTDEQIRIYLKALNQ